MKHLLPLISVSDSDNYSTSKRVRHLNDLAKVRVTMHAHSVILHRRIGIHRYMYMYMCAPWLAIYIHTHTRLCSSRCWLVAITMAVNTIARILQLHIYSRLIRPTPPTPLPARSHDTLPTLSFYSTSAWLCVYIA